MRKEDWLIIVVPAVLAAAVVGWFNGDQLFLTSNDTGVTASVPLPAVPSSSAAPSLQSSAPAPRGVIQAAPPLAQAAPPARKPMPTPAEPAPARTKSPTPPRQEATPLERGRSLTNLFYDGQLPRLWQTFSPSLRASWVNLSEFERYRRSGLERFGRETRVVNERVINHAGVTYYTREARFEGDLKGTWTVIVGLNPGGTVKEFDIVGTDVPPQL